jgi:hypothetical protein
MRIKAAAFWTDERVEQAKALYAEGLSHRRIGKILGCSRNACIGKLTRLGLAGPHGSSPRKQGHHTGERVTRPTGPRQSPRRTLTVKDREDALALEPLGPVAEFAPRGTCQFTYGDVAEPDWRMCGRPGFPWCEHHKAVVFVAGSAAARGIPDPAGLAEIERNSGARRAFGGA